ncbi:MAG TPA: SusC/RagA family TonB-linked outer membrane protein [Porphyromonadaceae bacterium]|jgi:TonB-linked SusC/RagA family outer membrane protein|nr:SusC/RagA family TonB-linked outer membrane protein [Porphyromonadaceae bacterium]
MKRKMNLLLMLCFISMGIAFGQTRVAGHVMDEAGDPIIGASVQVKGSTGQGTITDVDGNFGFTAPAGATTLVVSYVGMITQEVPVSANVRVVLVADNRQLEEVVVTAMGIKKERKALGYSVSDLNSEELLKNKNTNVINSLAGKIPGVNITQSSGAAGAGASITIRGGNSTSEGRENQPLFVVDGVIYDNSTSVVGNSAYDGMTRNSTTFSNRVMDVNPEDIETMSVLKGAAAAALYGSRAADGVIIITTKKGEEGTIKVDVSSKLSTSWATKLPETQTEFGRGYYENNGVFNDLTYQSWGKRITDETLYDNIGSFFQNGVIYDNNVSISSGNKNGSFYLSASNYDQTGIVPETGYDKTTFRLNGEQKYGRLTVNANVAYSLSNTNKTLTSAGLWEGGGNGTMTALYSWPLTEDMSKYLNEDGTKYRLFEGRLDLVDDKENPYWIINKNKMTDKNKRFTGSLGASFKITDWWDISSRVGYDQYTTDAYTYIAPGSVVREIYQNGRLSKNDYNYSYITTNLMSNFHKTFDDFDFNLLLGSTTESTEILNQTHWGYNFITAGTISFSNISSENQFFKDATTKKRLVGAYGEFRASYKNLAYLTVTGRNDWSSTLPLNNRSYFYPSISGSFVFTELMPKSDVLSFGKVRASWAQVGKDANPYATLTYLTNPISYGSYVGVGNYYVSGNAYLKPEIQTAWEVGGELRFLNGRIGLDYTYYHSQTKNQIASPRLSNANGYIMSSINSGSVINDGMEIALSGKPVVSRDFEWNVTLNTSYNRGKLGDFLDGVEIFYPTDAQFGTIKAASIPNGGYFLGLVGSRFARETKKVGEKDVEIEGGRYKVNPATGLYEIYSSSNEVVGNREPKFIGGLNNSFRYKDLSVSFLLDFRIGGDVYNGTEYYMVSNGLSKRTTENGREYVTVNGVDSKTGEDFNQTYYADQEYTIAGATYSGKAMIQKYWNNYLSHSYNFISSVNWLKLRSLSISYDFTNLIKRQNVIKGLTVTATGTNLFTLTNYKGMDPEVSTAGGTGGSGATGIDYCSVPATSSFTFGVNVTF